MMSKKMDVYLVRRVSDKGILGVFWGSPATVWDTVDELGDPCIFEAAKIGPGAIYIDGASEPVWGQYDDAAEDCYEVEGPEDFTGYTPSELLSNAIHDQKTLKWKRLDYTDEGVGMLRRILDKIERNK